jgi:hypothetical protein
VNTHTAHYSGKLLTKGIELAVTHFAVLQLSSQARSDLEIIFVVAGYARVRIQVIDSKVFAVFRYYRGWSVLRHWPC